MDNPESIRMRAVRLYAMADTSPERADKLVAEAIELLDQATAIENGAMPPPSKGEE